MKLTETPEWRALAERKASFDTRSIASLFDGDPERVRRFTFQAPSVSADLSRNLVDWDTIDDLLKLLRRRDFETLRSALFDGEGINTTEHRPAWHTALRTLPKDVSVERTLRDERGRFLAFAEALRAGSIHGSADTPVDTVVCIGIGGSDLGPRLVAEALGPAHGRPRVRFVSNIDPAELDEALADANPATCLLVVISKSFTTLESLENAQAAIDWLHRNAPAPIDTAHHVIAVTAHPERAIAFGVHPKRVFTFPDWVGGRYSVWSACGIAIAIAHGHQAFEELLAGAADMDAHFAHEPPASNLPVLLGLLGVWYVNFWGARARSVFPYVQRLRHLPAYLQQLEMESNGKRVDRDGKPVELDTAPIVWGEVGTTAQHSVFQFMHQGTHWSPSDFVVVAQFAHSAERRHRLLHAFALAQADALAWGDRALAGKGAPPPYATVPGGRPSTVITLPQLDARSIGALLALYEHRTFVQSVVWNINAFDQWGVEIGKNLLKQRLERSPI